MGTRVWSVVVSLIFVVGCGSKPDSTATPTGTTPTASATTPGNSEAKGEDDLALSDAQLSTLQAADVHDGTEDGVVGECSRCGLAMPGEAKYSSSVDEYELHFCGEGCRDGFQADPEKGIAEIQEIFDSE